jgi:hypothetical protein
MLFHGEIVSMMILRPAKALSTSRCTRSVSDFKNSKMNSGAERKMPVRLAREIKFFRVGIRLRIEVGCRQHGHDLLAPFQPDTAEFDLFANKPRFGELHHRNEPQEFFHRQTSPAPVFLQPIAQRWIS